MQSVHRSVLVPYSARQMFDLVDDVEQYCEFLPWCGGSKVVKTTGDGKVARIDIDFKGVTAHFTTRNVNKPPESIAMLSTVVDGATSVFVWAAGSNRKTPPGEMSWSDTYIVPSGAMSTAVGFTSPERTTSGAHATPWSTLTLITSPSAGRGA